MPVDRLGVGGVDEEADVEVPVAHVADDARLHPPLLDEAAGVADRARQLRDRHAHVGGLELRARRRRRRASKDAASSAAQISRAASTSPPTPRSVPPSSRNRLGASGYVRSLYAFTAAIVNASSKA